MGSEKALEFTAAYTMEKALSVDNLFVFILVFSYFCVPDKWQYKVLFWGVIGALVFRGLFIVAGIALVEQFSWMVYIFGAFLIFTGVKMLLQQGEGRSTGQEPGHPRFPPLHASDRGIP